MVGLNNCKIADNVKFPRDSWTHMNASCPYLWLREVAYANVYTSLVVLRVLNLPMMPFLAKVLESIKLSLPR
ncbi:hypothetical protein QQP08_015874 [Theobroma cacao]|nr:hypothetical protein QQP08_015874 [Theobroma cacao]